MASKELHSSVTLTGHLLEANHPFPLDTLDTFVFPFVHEVNTHRYINEVVEEPQLSSV